MSQTAERQTRTPLAGDSNIATIGALVADPWIQRSVGNRAVKVTDAGREGLDQTFGIPGEPRVSSG